MSFSPDYLGTAPSNASAVTARRITSSPDHRKPDSQSSSSPYTRNCRPPRLRDAVSPYYLNSVTTCHLKNDVAVRLMHGIPLPQSALFEGYT